MKNSFLFSVILLGLFVFLTGCKSKQQTVALSGAHAEAGKTVRPINATDNTNMPSTAQYVGEIKPAVPTQQVEAAFQAPAVSEPEEVRDEKFTLDTEEKNTEAIKMKYHVVVGSFKNRDNAKNLQTTLNSEGNDAIIVVNEYNMYRVLIASYNEYIQAREKINQIKSRFPDTWVLVQKED